MVDFTPNSCGHNMDSKYLVMGMIVGAGVGVVMGPIIGAVTGDVGTWVALGLPIGAGIGLSIGAVLATMSAQSTEGVCEKCGYSTKGLRSRVCPECGGDLRASEA